MAETSTLMTPSRIRLARIIAVAADCLEIMILPLFIEGYLSPVNDVLDIGVGIALMSLLGWHWAFLPSFIAEMIPVISLVPSWTAAVFLVTGVGPAPQTPTTPSAPTTPQPPSSR